MKHIKIDIQCVGDPMTALSTTKDIAKELGTNMYIKFLVMKEVEKDTYFTITVSPNSEVTDLFKIYLLEAEKRKSGKI